MKSLIQKKPGSASTSASTTMLTRKPPVSRSGVVPFSVGDCVHVIGTEFTGVARYVGSVHFSTGTWVGLELPSPTGRNDGSVQGKRFFTCEPNYGLFIKSVGCEKIDDSPNEVGGSQSDGGEGCSADAEPSTFGGLRENSVTVKLLRLKDQEAKKRAESKQRPSAAPVRRAAVEGIVRRGDTVGAETAQRWHAESPAVAQMQTALDSLAAHVAALDARTQQLEGVVIKIGSGIASAEGSIAKLHTGNADMESALAKCCNFADVERSELQYQLTARGDEVETLRESFASVSALALEAQELLRARSDVGGGRIEQDALVLEEGSTTDYPHPESAEDVPVDPDVTF